MDDKVAFAAMCAADFEVYGQTCLKILDKAGNLIPLVLNAAQRIVHGKLEAQKARTGKVRALILKGRQQGISTYVQARFRHILKHTAGQRAFVLSHEQDASDNLYGIFQRYHDHEPSAVRPSTGASNAKEMLFDRLDSLYSVATAGTKDTGRSGTAQLFHGSEVGFWKNANLHFAGIGQTIPDADGTEIVLEGTANGRGNEYHRRWRKAEAGESEYIAIFIPWFLQPEYRRKAPPGMRPDEEEQRLMERHGLDLDQICWRRIKIADDFNGNVLLFQQEYPCTPQEAFIATDRETLVKIDHVLASRASKLAQLYGPLIIGVDPAFSETRDRMAMAWRRSRVVTRLRSVRGRRPMEAAAMLAQVIDSDKPAAMMIEKDGLGFAIIDRLSEMGYGAIVRAVVPGGAAINHERFRNKRAECWGLMADWFADEPNRIPDDDELEAELLMPGYHFTSNRQLVIEEKEKIRDREGVSPDLADALAMTFSEPVRETERPRPRSQTPGFEPLDVVLGY